MTIGKESADWQASLSNYLDFAGYGSNTQNKTQDVISSPTLAQTQTFQAPPQAPPTAVTGALDSFAASDPLKESLQKNTEDYGTLLGKNVDEYVKAFLDAPTKESLQSDIYSREGGVNDIQAQLDEYDQKLLEEQVGLRRRLQIADKNKAGLFGGALQDEKFDLETESLQRQADISVIRLGIQRKFDSAKSSADMAVNAIYADEMKRIDAMKFQLDLNKELYDKNERRLFELELSDRENAAEEKRATKSLINDLAISALKDGAPPSVVERMFSAGSIGEAVALGGAYVGSQDRLAASRAERNADLTRRAALIALAKEGDQEAIDELGFDPRKTNINFETLQEDLESVQTSSDIVDGLLGNTRGLYSSTGSVQNAGLTGFFRGGKAEGWGTVTRFTPVIGNVQGVVQTINDKNNFLSGVSFLVNSSAFEMIKKLKSGGVTFGNMSDGERIAAGRAANELNAAVQVDSQGNVIGIRASDDQVKIWLKDMKVAFDAQEDDLIVKMYLPEEDKKAIYQSRAN